MVRPPSLHRRKDKARFKALAAWLKKKRDELNMSTHRLAKASKVNQPLIIEFESGRRTLSVFDLMRIANGLHLSWSQVAGHLDGFINDTKLDGPKVWAPHRPKKPKAALPGPATP